MNWLLRPILFALVASIAACATAPQKRDELGYPTRIADLEPRFLEPDGFQWGHFSNGDGAQIRYGWIEPEGGSRAIAVLLPGRSAHIEKYFEPMRSLLARGFAVWAMDWRGQGGSERYLDNPQKGHTLGFEHDVADLHQFITTIVKRRGRPLFILTESFGGHLALRYLHEHEDGVDFAVIMAPMLAIDMGPAPTWLACGAASLATSGGFGESYVPAAGDWDPGRLRPVDTANSSDPVRYSIMFTWFWERPDLRLGDPTYRWVDVACESMAVINEPEYLDSISLPVLMVSALADAILIPATHERACGLMPNCRLSVVPDARHELIMERDELRDQFFEAFDRFVAEMLADGGNDKSAQIVPVDNQAND